MSTGGHIPKVDLYIQIGETHSNEWGQCDPVFLKIPKGQLVSIVHQTGKEKEEDCIVLLCGKHLSPEESYLLVKYNPKGDDTMSCSNW
ncbi:hypothetical protein A3B84_02770 [Candidatus Nomurabacteria bacterium RIFCSPHIGHO2_02_FULL_35_13]|uniref:Uncharacterized protein n=1 Tax=Candidatus Nomurabacteria bacterium RIFCSPHIGHO2_02_FULL_35_13 TaxID=1801748 RepID=A0A1F6VQ66_9BACT|nr:MAG: hypothetical protein A3B84_02770 [Candidatus Nomurabacteria bacterium RIFCSPHIGHO2_02_FULL_35_13]